LAIVSFAASGCAEVPENSEAQPVVASEPTVAEVVGGQTSDACDWPSTVGVNGFASCTGTLIHPRVVTTAAHCLSGTSATIYFGAGKSQTGSFSLTARCRAGAKGAAGANTNKDWAYCVLPDDDRVKQIPITPPLVGCEADKFLKPGASAWVVGFGTTGPTGLGAGVKRQVEVKVNSLDKPLGTINVGDATVGACHGDSGGPIYMHLSDATHDWGYRVFGSTSGAGANNCDCTCSTVYINIENHVAEIEKTENIDVTPCTDSAGNWAPSADCKAFQSKPQEGTGSFPGCSVPVTQDAIDSCGMSAAAGSGGASGASAGAGGRAGASGAAGAAGGGGRSGAGGLSAGAGGLGASGRGAGAGGVAAGAAGGTAGFGSAGFAGSLTGLAGYGAFAGNRGAGAGGISATGTLSNGLTAFGAAGSAGAGVFAPPAATNLAPPGPVKGGCQIASGGTRTAASWGWSVAGLILVFGWRVRSAAKRRLRLQPSAARSAAAPRFA
jgi:hypothetical protein